MRAFPCGDGLVLPAERERLLVLDAHAANIWRAFDAGIPASEIVAAISRGQPETVARVEQDVSALIAAWTIAADADPGRGQSDPETLLPAGPAAWAGEWRCRLRGAVFEIAVEHPRHAGVLARWIERFPASDRASETRIEVRVEADELTVTTVDGVVRGRGYGLQQAIRAMIGLAWPEHEVVAMLHAGAVAGPQGGLCIAGVSGSGKSTLIGALVRAGYDYRSDDAVPLTMAGKALPWPLPLSVKEASWPLFAERFPALRTATTYKVKNTRARMVELGAPVWPEPQPVGALIFPHFRPGDTPESEPVSALNALQRLIEAGLSVEAPVTDARIEALIGWIERTPAFTLPYGDVAAAVERVNALTLAAR